MVMTLSDDLGCKSVALTKAKESVEVPLLPPTKRTAEDRREHESAPTEDFEQLTPPI